jgi:type IV pilus assembly protein PilW
MSTSKTHTPRFRQRGVSMVELMIAMLLGLFLMAGVLQLFSSNKQTFGSMEGIADIQDGARAGIERLKSRVRMAGYMGCSNANALSPNNITTGNANVAFGPNVMITGVDNDANTGNSIVDGTDALTVVFATAANTAINANMTSRTGNIVISSNPNNFRMDDALIITDCENADVFGVSNFTGTGPYTIAHALNDQNGDQVNTTTSLSKPYLANNSLIMSLSNVGYEVRDTTRTDDTGNPVLALFEIQGATATEVVTGVEDMQIEYGVDTSASPDGEADVYQDAAAMGASQWARIVSVRINLLIATEREIGPKPRPSLDLAGNALSDRRMRRAFTTTIGLRNRSS